MAAHPLPQSFGFSVKNKNFSLSCIKEHLESRGAITKTSGLMGDHPFTLPDVKPAMKNLWKQTKSTTTGMRLSTDMANT